MDQLSGHQITVIVVFAIVSVALIVMAMIVALCQVLLKAGI